MAGLTQRLEVKQTQSLAMTPQLQMSLKILQLSNQELSEYISQELEKNPLLSLSSDDQETSPSQNQESDEQTGSEVVSQDESSDSDNNAGDSDKSENYEQENDYESRSPDQEENRVNIKSRDRDLSDTKTFYEQIPVEDIILREHLLDQINIDFTDEIKKRVALHLLDMLDENGYIQVDFAALSALLGCREDEIEETLFALQKLDPPGIFARSLAECLTLQLKDRNRFDPAMEKLIANLDLLAKAELGKLQKICSVNEEDMIEMCREIKSLDPKPGIKFSHEKTQVVQPDIFLRRKNDGAWAIELNSETLPRLIVNNKYYAEVKSKTRDGNERKYITDNYNNANWLIRTLNQRAETILKVASEIVSQQHDFFEKGIYHLKPLILRDIAEKVDLHESTVARVTNNKYISTPRGLYELKYFFSSSLQSSSGQDDLSSKAVKHLIAELINRENAEDILSDDAISVVLKEKGIYVARRTVAKYRESMNIPTSTKRRQKKKMAGI